MSEYGLIRSRRRSVALRVLPDGGVEVRAPLLMSRRSIDRFVAEHEAWIARQRRRMAAHAEKYPEPTEEERRELIRRAKAELPPLVEKYAALMGVAPAGIAVTGARTRFGSCSAKNRLCFSWRLMRYPPEAVEAVVVHELAHILRKDHSPAFYAAVTSVLPDYKERSRLLKE